MGSANSNRIEMENSLELNEKDSLEPSSNPVEKLLSSQPNSPTNRGVENRTLCDALELKQGSITVEAVEEDKSESANEVVKVENYELDNEIISYNDKYDSIKKEPENVPSDDERPSESLSTVKKGKLTSINEKGERLKDYCFYCKTMVFSFSRHIQRNHPGEAEVAQIVSKQLGSKERKSLLSLLRKKGNFLINSEGCKRPVKRSKITSDFLPCSSCLGYYSSKLLWRHRKICPLRSKTESATSARVDSQNLLIKNLKIDPTLREEVFSRMRPDAISLAAKNDSLICAFGARYLKIHRDKHFIQVTSRKMRELSRILIEMRKLNSSIRTLFHALKPQHFELIVEAIKSAARFNYEKKTYESHSFAMNIGSSLKQCCNIAILYALKKKDEHAEADLRTLKSLLNSDWKFDISSQAADDVNMKKGNNMPMVPLVQDLECLNKIADAAKEGKSLDDIEFDLMTGNETPVEFHNDNTDSMITDRLHNENNNPSTSSFDHIERVNVGQKRNLLIKHLNVDPTLREEVFPRMRRDAISLAAKNDSLICAFGARYLKINREKRFIHVTSRKMRELSRILIEMRKLNSSIRTLFHALKPQHFELIVEAIKTAARFNYEKKCYESHSFATNIGSSLKQCCDIAILYALEKKDEHAEADLRTLKSLLNSDWKFDISCQAADDLNMKKGNNVPMVSSAQDFTLIKECSNKIADAVKEGKSLDDAEVDLMAGNETPMEFHNDNTDSMMNENNNPSTSSFDHTERVNVGQKGNLLIKHLNVDPTLREEVFPRMRRDAISLVAKNDSLICAFGARYLKIHRERRFINVTSRKMRELSRILIEMRKLNSSIRTLFHALQPQHFELIVKAIKTAARFNYEKNTYESQSFAMNIGSSLKQCCDIAILYDLKKKDDHAEADLKTLKSLLNSDWKFDISSKAADDLNMKKENNVPMVPLAQDFMLIKECLNKIVDAAKEGKSLDTVDLMVGNETLKEFHNDNTDSMFSDRLHNKNNNPSTSSFDHTKRVKVGQKRILVPWTDEQKSRVLSFFKSHIRNKKPPKRRECDVLINRHTELFHNKNWLKIKVFVQNQYSQK